jgi:hypothetical protein
MLSQRCFQELTLPIKRTDGFLDLGLRAAR